MKEIMCGKITIQIGDYMIYEVDILAKNTIQKKGIFDYYKELRNRFFGNSLQELVNSGNIF